MCGRYTLTLPDYEALAHALGVAYVAEHADAYKPRYNVAPTDLSWVLRVREGKREIVPARWGFVGHNEPDPSRGPRRINARSETAAQKWPFREAFAKRRCVVPADGFYEWTGDKRDRRPVWFHPQGGGLLLFAGLHETWQTGPESWERTFTILTTAANDVVSPIHDRMPVLLGGEGVDAWLDPERPVAALRSLLAPAPNDALVLRSVSKRVSSVKNDDAACLEPLDDEVGAQAMLF